MFIVLPRPVTSCLRGRLSSTLANTTRRLSSMHLLAPTTARNSRTANSRYEVPAVAGGSSRRGTEAAPTRRRSALARSASRRAEMTLATSRLTDKNSRDKCWLAPVSGQQRVLQPPVLSLCRQLRSSSRLWSSIPALAVSANPALEPTRYGRPRLAAPGHPCSLSFRGQSRPASAGGSALR